MRSIVSKSLAIASLLALFTWATGAGAATRPQYGGVLHMELQAAPADFAPEVLASKTPPSEELTALIFDRLCRLNERGEMEPQLATHWEHDATFQHWTFTLRQHVHLHNGGGLSPGMVMGALSLQNARWRVRYEADKLTIETPESQPSLLYELALPRNAIAVRTGRGPVVGTGPFRVLEWTPRKHATLRAFDEYWGGRPYLDAIEVTLGRTPAEQFADFAAGKAELVEVNPATLLEVERQGLRKSVGPSRQLLALIFDPNSNAVADPAVRRAIAIPLDRAALGKLIVASVLTPTNQWLPEWLHGQASGSASAVATPPSAKDINNAKLALQKYLHESSAGTLQPGSTPPAPVLSLAYDATDIKSRTVAIQLQATAKESGIKLMLVADQPGAPPETPPDMQLRYFRVASPDYATALIELSARVSAEALASTRESVNAANLLPATEREAALARVEADRMAEMWLVPIGNAPLVRGFDPRIKNWRYDALDGLRVEDLWLPQQQTSLVPSGSKPSMQ